MSNRDKIIKFCKNKRVEIISLTFMRNMDYCYGDSWDSSHWVLITKINGKEEVFDSAKGDDVYEGISIMFDDITRELLQV